VPPLAANMTAAFKKVSVAIGETNSVQSDLIATRIVELAKDGVYDVEELSGRALSSLKSGKPPSQQDRLEQTSLNEGLNLSASSPDLTHV
jgi:hypothetical protein